MSRIFDCEMTQSNINGMSRLADVLMFKEISQYRLSKESGVSLSEISKLCCGHRDLSRCDAQTLQKISNALDISVDELLNSEHYSTSDMLPVYDRVFRLKYRTNTILARTDALCMRGYGNWTLGRKPIV